jgi:hypothetical protein
MAGSSEKPRTVRSALAILENPYVFVDECDEVYEREVARGASRDAESTSVPHSSSDVTSRSTLADLQNPYAFAQESDEAHERHEGLAEQQPVIAPSASISSPTSALRGRLSKTEFGSRCRAIFGPYSPALNRGRLRSHHRDFITRNQARSAEERYQIWLHLKKYDLSDLPGLSTQFNREDDLVTEEKLREIERLVDKK